MSGPQRTLMLSGAGCRLTKAVAYAGEHGVRIIRELAFNFVLPFLIFNSISPSRGADDRLDAAYPAGDRGFHSGTEGGRHLRPGVERHCVLDTGLRGRRRRQVPAVA